MRGTLGPYTSASSSPTLAPEAARAAARLAATVLLPTPPLPLATAIKLVTWETPRGFCGRGASDMAAEGLRGDPAAEARFREGLGVGRSGFRVRRAFPSHSKDWTQTGYSPPPRSLSVGPYQNAEP